MPYKPSEQRLLREFGDRLRKHRVEAQLSQEELAELANLHRTYVGSCERGQRNVSLLNIVAIANALNVDVQVLLGPELGRAGRVGKIRLKKRPSMTP